MTEEQMETAITEAFREVTGRCPIEDADRLTWVEEARAERARKMYAFRDAGVSVADAARILGVTTDAIYSHQREFGVNLRAGDAQ